MKKEEIFSQMVLFIGISIAVSMCLLMDTGIIENQAQMNSDDYVYSYTLNNVEKEIQSPNSCDIKNMTCEIGDTTFKVDSITILKGDK